MIRFEWVWRSRLLALHKLVLWLEADEYLVMCYALLPIRSAERYIVLDLIITLFSMRMDAASGAFTIALFVISLAVRRNIAAPSPQSLFTSSQSRNPTLLLTPTTN